VVAAGDTLWALAADLTEPGADVRRVVAEIEQLNGLDGATIYPGQVLTLPTG
jgi:LysM repeat protein